MYPQNKLDVKLSKGSIVLWTFMRAKLREKNTTGSSEVGKIICPINREKQY